MNAMNTPYIARNKIPSIYVTMFMKFQWNQEQENKIRYLYKILSLIYKIYSLAPPDHHRTFW